MADFLLQEWRTSGEEHDLGRYLSYKDSDPSWVISYLLRCHGSLEGWKASGVAEADDPDPLSKDRVYCSPGWQNNPKRDWRRDYIFIEEGSSSETTILGNRRVGQLYLIFTIRDPYYTNHTRGKMKLHYGVFMRLLKFRNKGEQHNVHGMIELEHWPSATIKRARQLKVWKVFPIKSVLRSAHVVPANGKRVDTSDEGEVYYLNNYADWDLYQSLFEDDFMSKRYRVASQYQ